MRKNIYHCCYCTKLTIKYIFYMNNDLILLLFSIVRGSAQVRLGKIDNIKILRNNIKNFNKNQETLFSRL